MPWDHGMEAPHGMLRAGEVFWLKNLAVDDERLALQLLTDAIQAVLPEAEVFAFSKPGEALSCATRSCPSSRARCCGRPALAALRSIPQTHVSAFSAG